MNLTDSISRFSAAFLLLVLADPAIAATVEEEMRFCDSAGELALATTAARDSGVTKMQALGLVDDAGAPKEFYAALISLIYAMEGVEAPLMKQVAIQMCHKKLGLK